MSGVKIFDYYKLFCADDYWSIFKSKSETDNIQNVLLSFPNSFFIQPFLSFRIVLGPTISDQYFNQKKFNFLARYIFSFRLFYLFLNQQCRLIFPSNVFALQILENQKFGEKPCFFFRSEWSWKLFISSSSTFWCISEYIILFSLFSFCDLKNNQI